MATRAVSAGTGSTAVLPAPTAVSRVAPASGSAAGGGPTAEPAAITVTLRTVPFAEGVLPLPGPWSADGTWLVAFAASATGDEHVSADPEVRVWTVDAELAKAEWDSGDVEDRLTLAGGLAAWRTDGTLALARSLDMVVTPEGKSAGAAAVGGQPSQVDVAPDGRTVLANGPQGAWLLGADGQVRVVQGLPAGGFDSWDWRPNGGELAMAGHDGGLYIVDVASGASDKVAEMPGADRQGRYAPPRWLADGRVLLSDAIPTRVGAAGGLERGLDQSLDQSLDHRIVDPRGGASVWLDKLAGVPASAETPLDASGWVSADGALVLVPEVGRSSDGRAAARWWLVDVLGHQLRAAPGMSSSPSWSPTGYRVAYGSGSGVEVWMTDTDARRAIALPGRRIQSFVWSPSGRWLALLDDQDGLWLAAVDVEAGPTLIAEHVDSTAMPTFSPGDARVAATVRAEDGTPALVLLDFGIERP